MNKRFVAAVIALAVTAAAFCMFMTFFSGEKLVVRNSETGMVYKTFEAREGLEFAVEFIHSVNKSPVRDVFVIRGGQIVADRTVYSAFGAGVQTEIEKGQKLEYDSKGNMVVSGFDIVFDKVKYIVGTVSDHVLYIEGESISLTELCGKNAHVAFELEQ
ncbi:MAG: DUF1850 domain-containing protein [Ruminococcaceae bacterium]|nr:DUF1850 domain-containing protein [Oscillospiraceae bacterium]